MNLRMHSSVAVVFLDAANRLYARDQTGITRIIGLMTLMNQLDDASLAALLQRIEALIAGGTASEADEIEELGRSLGL